MKLMRRLRIPPMRKGCWYEVLILDRKTGKKYSAVVVCGGNGKLEYGRLVKLHDYVQCKFQLLEKSAPVAWHENCKDDRHDGFIAVPKELIEKYRKLSKSEAMLYAL